MTQHFTRAIATGNPKYLAASTFYVGLGQWEYGNFMKNVQLPEGLTLAGVVAAILPARRASRLDVLRAVASE